jgi:hypothetical protein
MPLKAPAKHQSKRENSVGSQPVPPKNQPEGLNLQGAELFQVF